ncbi:hypothetical protein ACQEVF_32305 [Nonomuraea polychroma]|uniref:hypothetical protein n=1 Tax=Nonomuraea polychroma TaxID=46176 RepID=UPI003D90AF7B
MTTYEAAYRQAETLKASGASREFLLDRAERFDAAWQFSSAAAFRAVAYAEVAA